MPILLLGSLLSALVVAPLRTVRIYRDAEAWETRQIAVDNAAIRLGQSDRGVFRSLREAHRIAMALEAIHHPLHACARAVVTTGECFEPDLAIEAEIEAFHRTTEGAARAMWRWGEVGLPSLALESLRRPEIPLTEKRCAVCGLASNWELSLPTEAWLRASSSPRVEATERLRKDGEYELE